MDDRCLYDNPAAAAYLGTSERHLQHLRTTRRIPYVKLGGGHKIRYRQEDLDAWIDEHTVAPASRAS